MTAVDMDVLRAGISARYGPARSGPPAEPTVADLRTGWSKYETAPGNSDFWPRGGVVVDSWRAPDEDGEAHDHHLLVKAHQGGLVFVTLRADRLSAESVKRPNDLVVRDVCRTAARALADRKAQDWRKDLSDLDLWSLGTRLTKAIAR